MKGLEPSLRFENQNLNRFGEFPEAIETVFPEAQVQLCLVHQVRVSLNYVSWKQRKAVAADLKPIYQASTVEQAGQRLEEFAAKWDAAYPAISQMWRRNWDI